MFGERKQKKKCQQGVGGMNEFVINSLISEKKEILLHYIVAIPLML